MECCKFIHFSHSFISWNIVKCVLNSWVQRWMMSLFHKLYPLLKILPPSYKSKLTTLNTFIYRNFNRKKGKSMAKQHMSIISPNINWLKFKTAQNYFFLPYKEFPWDVWICSIIVGSCFILWYIDTFLFVTTLWKNI